MTQYTIQQAAEIIQQSPEAVRKYILAGKLKAAKDGRRYLINKTDLYQYLINTIQNELDEQTTAGLATAGTVATDTAGLDRAGRLAAGA